MMRLIVEEGGQRRAFKLGEGRLTIGSGEAAKLRLTSEGVAEVHAELEISGGQAVLRSRPGVTAPRVGGVPVSGEQHLAGGEPIQIGEATLRLETEESAAKAAKPAAGRGRGPANVGAAAAVKAPARGEWQRSRLEMSKRGGLKTWQTLLIFALVLIPGAFITRALFMSEPAPIFLPRVKLEKALADLANGRTDRAEEELDGIPAEAKLPPEMIEKIAQVRRDIETAREQILIADRNLIGNEVLQTQLQNFEQNYLQGTAERPKIRVFLKRCAEFKKDFPYHPEVSWVERMEERYAAIVDMNDPPTFEDLAFEVKTLTWANPRDYKQAFAVIQRFLETATPDDRAQALALFDEKDQERDDWFTDRMLQARYEFERGQIGTSVAWLVNITVYVGDDDMSNQAAAEMIKFDGIIEWLRGYRRAQPAKYEALAKNPIVAGFLEENEI